MTSIQHNGNMGEAIASILEMYRNIYRDQPTTLRALEMFADTLSETWLTIHGPQVKDIVINPQP